MRGSQPGTFSPLRDSTITVYGKATTPTAGLIPMNDVLPFYTRTRLLHESHGVQTYLGVENSTQKSVIIKTLDLESAPVGVRLRLEHEALVLGRLSSKFVSAPLAVHHAPDGSYLVTEYAEGISLREKLKSGPLSVRQTLQVGLGLAEALREVHANGILHRDIKPSNTVVGLDPENPQITLIDFGFAQMREWKNSARREAVGTACYASPEQAGLIKTTVDERSDLYAVGIVLYECLSGKCPFLAENMGEVLRKQLSFTPPLLRELKIRVPRVFDDILQRLLQKDPRRRYQTAGALLFDLQKLWADQESGNLNSAWAIGSQDSRTTLTDPAFIGREEYLSVLSAALEQAARNRGGIVTIEAESGGGKTRLLEEFVIRNADRFFTPFFGQGLSEAASRPYQVLSGVADHILLHAKSDPGFSQTLQNLPEDFRHSIALALPELKPLFEFQTAEPEGPEAFGKARVLRALSALLDTLGTTQNPAVVVFDDCQWMDAQTLELVSAWAESKPKGPILIILAFRTEEVAKANPLRTLKKLQHLSLTGLGESEIDQLVRSMAGDVPASIPETIGKLAGGSPFMAAAVLRGLVESRTLSSDESGWHIDSNALNNIAASREAAVFLTRRLSRLPESLRHLLGVASLLGKRFDLEMLTSVLGSQVSVAEVLGDLEEARRMHFIWQSAQGDQFHFVHDKVREAFLSSLDPQRKIQLHATAARWLETTHPERDFDLAFHFYSAEQPARALPYALSSAQSARAQFSLETAEAQLLIAEKATEVSAVDPAIRRQIAEGLGDVLMLMGKYEPAHFQFERALFYCESPFAQATILGKIAELFFKRGNMKRARQPVERALKLLGHKPPPTELGLAISLLGGSFIQALHTVFPRILVGRRKVTDAAKVDLLTVRLYSRLTYVYWFGRGTIACLWSHIREMNLAERYQPTAELAQAYSEHAPLSTAIPWYSRGERYVAKSWAIRKAAGDTWGQGQSLNFYALVLYTGSRFEACLEKGREATALLERTGDQWELNIANWHMAASLYRQGELSRAAEMMREIYEAGLSIGDYQIMGNCLSIWAMASEGRLPAELIQNQLSRDDEDKQIRVVAMIAEGIRLLLGENQSAEAAAILRTAKQDVRRGHLRTEYIMPVYPWLVTALRMEAERNSVRLTPMHRRKLLREAWRESRSALRMARCFRNSLPHVLRERGILLAALGKSRAARRALDESIRVAEAQGALAELRNSRLVHQQLSREMGWAVSHSIPPRLPPRGPDLAVPTLSLVDRFSTLLEIGRKINSALDRPAVFNAIEEAVSALLRGENCLVFECEKLNEAPVLVRSRGAVNYSSQMVQQVLKSGEVSVFLEAGDLDPTESLALGEVRSALCAPILVRGKVTGCFYVAHRQVDSLFGEEEKQLALFISGLAGVALENAAILSELQRSNADLESFAFITSHDLKEPLRSVSTHIQMLGQSASAELGGQALQNIDSAVREISRMYSLIDAILGYCRVGLEPRQRGLTDLNDVVAEALGAFKNTIDEKGVAISVKPLPSLSVDRAQIQELFQNLVGNALKFQKSEHPEVRIEATREGHEWIFSVKDNGIGIAPEYHKKVFAMFQRLHPRDRFPGTGIGLSICKRIVERHEGRIWVDSDENRGACFKFALPEQGALINSI